MNIAVLADIHGNYGALCAVTEDMVRCGVDGVIVLGDIIFPGDAPQACFDAIKKLNPLAWIRGNTDDWLNEIKEGFVPANEVEKRVLADFRRIRPLISDETAKTVAALPEKQRAEIEGYRLLCVHGSDRRINEPVGLMTSQQQLQEIADRMDADVLLCGHTHSPFVAALGGKLIINAGSVGKPADAPEPCYCLLRFGNVFEYGFRKLTSL
jgi:putative phosphoesterase